MIAGRPDRQLGGIWRWDDATNSRSTLDAFGPRVTEPTGRLNFGGQSEYNLMIAVDPSDADLIYIGGVRAYRSIDGGVTFREMAERIHVDWHAVVVDPNDPRRVLAGNDAEADVRPQLEIHTDAVQASHGATVGKLDDTMKFYLLSRGLDPEVAENLLKWAFIADVIARIPLPQIRTQLAREVASRMPGAPPFGVES